ncbi:YhcH/YjgK/YiaL family protein [Lacrimispora sp.]|uniref:YhcH/YjgK/YiaL family protein n=1 Tax=Lacrimispora sp. TaxID=2719234 RepID=UPI002FD94941
MLISSLVLAEHYDYLAEKFRISYAFLSRPDLADLPVGSIKLEQGVTASVQEYTTIPSHEGKYETHDRYFDIHYMVTGREVFDLAPRDALEEKIPYNAERDITIYHGPNMASQIILSQGELIVLSPEEAHMPKIIAGEPCTVKKIVLKVPVY